MPYVVVVAAVELLHNELGVKEDETAEQDQTKIQLKL